MSVKSFAEHIAEDRRLIILRALESCAGYESNESLLTMVLGDFGHAIARDQVRIELAWLKDSGLVTLSELGSVMIAILTQRGLETAQGVITVPGVKRPSPR